MKVSDEQKQIDQLLHEFENAIGKTFSISFKNDNIIVKANSDIVVSVDKELQLVTGEKGEYPVVWCHLKQEQPKELKKYYQQEIFQT
jgi:hypothetical protein